MRRLALIALSFTLVACGGQGDRTSTKSELAWVRGIAVWLQHLRADIGRAEDLRTAMLGGRSEARAAYKRAVARLGDCADRFDADVGNAPAARLDPGARMLREACVAYARGERTNLESFGDDPGDRLAAGSEAIDRGADLFLRGTQRLEAAFPWNARLPRIGGEIGRSRVEPAFSRVASTLARRPVDVRCWSTADWRRVGKEFRAYSAIDFEPAGFVAQIGAGRINLAPWVCAHLVDLAYANRVRHGEGGLDVADSVETLAHEAEHVIAPGGTEAETECYAMQDVRRVARLLGAPRAYADELATRAWRESYPNNTPEYFTPLCHDGGPLDAHAETSRWP